MIHLESDYIQYSSLAISLVRSLEQLLLLQMMGGGQEDLKLCYLYKFIFQSQIFVTDTQNRTHTLQVNLQTVTVTQLRTLVAEVTGVEPQHQRLVHNSQQLEDGQTLAQYRIRANARLTLTCRLQGGL